MPRLPLRLSSEIEDIFRKFMAVRLMLHFVALGTILDRLSLQLGCTEGMDGLAINCAIEPISLQQHPWSQ